MMQIDESLLAGLWYVALPSSRLARGKTHAVRLLGHPLLLGRSADGEVFALKDFCPHRGIPLRYGSFDGKEITCCYHGWRFDPSGRCTFIPSLVEAGEREAGRIKCEAFACREKYGLIWVFIPARHEQPPPLPDMPFGENHRFAHVESVNFPCGIDHAVIGLMDPSHGPFVHTSWWWRSKRSIHAKEKRFAPHGLGFRMVSHKPSSNSRAYRILGVSDRSTEIAFQLPGLRLEHIRAGKKNVVLLTALTPVDANNTMLHQFIYTDISLFKRLIPLLKPFGKAFIAQDLDVVKKQQEGLTAGHPPLMLLGDADAQARWYFRLKKEWQEATVQNRPFENRLKGRTLRWRS